MYQDSASSKGVMIIPKDVIAYQKLFGRHISILHLMDIMSGLVVASKSW